MAFNYTDIKDVNAPSKPPNEPSSSSVSDSSRGTAATTAAATPSDLPTSEEPNKEGNGPEQQDGEVSDQGPSGPARSRSPRLRPRRARRRSGLDSPSDSDEPLEDRILKAPRQRQNMVRYTNLMEDRVRALETKIRALEGNKKPSKSSAHDTAVKKDPLEKYKSLNSINRVNETEYKKKIQRHLIDVLVKDNMDVALDKDHQPTTTDTQKPAGRPGDSMTTATPERIRVNCGRLLVELDNVTDLETENVFLAPFTFFTTYEQKIRDHIAVLEKKSRGEDVATDSGNDIGEAAGDSNLQKETSDESQQQTKTSGDTVDHPEPRDLPSADAESHTDEKDAEAADGAETARNDDQNEEEEVDEDDLLPEDILAVVEDCNVSRSKAVKAMKEEGGSWYRASNALRRSMTKEELKIADAAKAGFLLQSWRTLIAVMDSDLRPKFELCSKIRNQTLREITYDDLGYLFKPGDVVLASQDQRLQALAVLATTGGRKLLLEGRLRRSNGDEEPESFFHTSGGHSPFVVDCFYYDFDGTNFGAILRSITIPKYEGKTPVNSLAVYPESLSGDANRDLKTILAERGRKFVQLCSMSAVAHRTYTGRTLDDPPEEVDSQVIIDCHMAAIVPANQRPDNAQWMPTLGMTQPTEPDEREITEIHADCYRQDCGICNNPRTNFVFNHQKFARQQSKEYVTSEEIVNRPFGEAELREHQYMLLPYRVFGFVLRSRKWGENNASFPSEQSIKY